jgi:hypothetical protein
MTYSIVLSIIPLYYPKNIVKGEASAITLSFIYMFCLMLAACRPKHVII